ncbi:MAG: hypothetical protein Q4E36_02900 [Bacillota bacterium]|nr:hypothetical protein [Bacillota bacterium]
MKKERRIKAILILGVLIALYYLWGYLDYKYERQILFFWESNFRKNWSGLTAGMTDQEIFQVYMEPFNNNSWRRFPIHMIFILAVRAVVKWAKGTYNCPKVYYGSFYKFLFSNIERFDGYVFVFAIYVFIEQIIKRLIGMDLSYVYGPLFLVLPLVYILYYIIKEYRIWKDLGPVEATN